MNTRLQKTFGAMCPLFVLALLVSGTPQRTAADSDDPSDRVGRLNYRQGSVSFQPAGESDWVSAVVNRPMTTGDRLWTDNGARAELQLGSATVRLGANTGFSFLNLDDQTVQVELMEGTLNIRVRRLNGNDIFEVDTPNQAFTILRPGQYRIQVSEDGNSTMITVRAGEGEVTGDERIYALHAGQTGTFSGNSRLYADIYNASGRDDFDRWSDGRDQRDDRSLSARYVSQDVVGYQDLDDYGSWRPNSTYGNVWMPRVSAGWAPYHDGHWAWIAPWGWTWVDDAPWGYAPFHYGRWVYVGNNWGWVPGPIAVRPVYAPALVVFVGGPRFGLSISVGGGGGYGGNVGWFPLGPREVYVPAYRTSREYVNRVNVTNTTVNNITITNVYNNSVSNSNNTNVQYANRSVQGSVTAVPQNVFSGGQQVGRSAVAVNAQEIAAAPVSRRAEIAPTRDSVLGNLGLRGNRVAEPPAAVASRSVVAKTAPPPPPVSFDTQQKALAARPGQPLARNEVENLRPANAPTAKPRVRQAPPGRPAPADSNQPGRQSNATQPTNQPPASLGTNAPADIAPPARNDPPASGRPNSQPSPENRPGRGNRGQPETVQPSLPPGNADAPVNVAPPARNDQPASGRPNNQPSSDNGPGRGSAPPARSEPPASAQPNNQPSPDARPGRGNRGQPDSVKPPDAPPAADEGANPPAKVAPGAANKGEPDAAQPNSPRAKPGKAADDKKNQKNQ